jgi:hypothetical protein
MVMIPGFLLMLGMNNEPSFILSQAVITAAARCPTQPSRRQETAEIRAGRFPFPIKDIDVSRNYRGCSRMQRLG